MKQKILDYIKGNAPKIIEYVLFVIAGVIIAGIGMALLK